MENKNNHVVIMAGGVGSRFWPMSTPAKPKQFIDVLGCGRTLLQLTVDRLGDLVPKENVWVVTGETYAELVYEQLPEIPRDHVLREPCRRGTAPCICYAAWRIKKLNPKATMVVTPSDHLVTNTDEFRRVLKNGLQFAGETDAILTLGMKPTRADTGYGYIQADLTAASARAREIFRVDSFRETPNKAVAEEYISHNNFFWNAGIFIMSVSTTVNAFRIHEKETSDVFENMLPIYGTDKEQVAVNENFPKCRNISVDYAIMERADEIFVYPAQFGWSDLGTWGSLMEQSSRDIHANAVIGNEVRLYETSNCMIHTTDMKQVVIQGLDGYIVSEKDGRLLICRLSEEQRIGKMSE